MNTQSSSQCPRCGAAIPAGAPQGICPRCLMQSAMNPTVIQQELPVPPPEEIIRAFPNLEILQLIGTGGMGRVYKVRQPHLDRIVALKILHPELAADPAFAERFSREARALARLSHPNIVNVYDFGKNGNFYWLMMEYVDGVNLRQAMQAGSMNPREALHIVPMICTALEYAHQQGVLHRDIKPENILIDTAGRVRIADFGVAKLRGGDGRHVTLTLSGSALGTPAYMAPEQIERPQDVDHRADIYSLGVVFYEMLTGELPLGRFPAPSEKAGTDPRLDTVVFRTLEKQRERRYQSAGEMKTQVEGYSEIPAPPAVLPQLPRAERMSRKAVWAMVLVLAGSVLGFAGVAFASVAGNRQSQEMMEMRVRINAEGPELTLPSNPSQRNVQPLPPPPMPVAGFLLALIPAGMILTGTFMGTSALRDIRMSQGRLGGAVAASIAAGFVLTVVIVIVAGGGLTLLMEEVAPRSRRRTEIWIVTGVLFGIWLGFLVMRKMYRYAVAWEPAPLRPAPANRSACATAAIILTIIGCAVALFAVVAADGLDYRFRYQPPEGLLVLDLAILLAGLICGVLAKREPAGKVCAWISGVVFVVLLLLVVA